MKRVYWRPRGISRTVLGLIAAVSVAGLVAVERLQMKTEQPYYAEKVEAARLALEAIERLRAERLQRTPDVDETVDPAGSGLIGSAMSPVTSDPGILSAKQTSINPNFAAIVVEWLKDAGVNQGDTVAVGASGSFPALNVCVYAAIETLKLKPIIISSVAASQWGANLPDFLWIDMEKVLQEYQVFDFGTVAASVGGIEDKGLGMDPQGRKLLADAIERNGLQKITPKSFTDSIDRRMAIYTQNANGGRIKAYVNVGGGTISVGTSIGKRMFEPGLNRRLPAGATLSSMVDSVMTRFSRQGVPVIHITQIEKLATHYGLPIQPNKMPEVGEGRVFYREQYNPWLAVAVLLSILASLYAFIRSELGYRILQVPRRSRIVSHEPMI